MSGARTPEDARAQAWKKHEIAENRAAQVEWIEGIQAPANRDEQILLSARRRAAESYPGCATAILNPDPARNWDNGSIIRDLVAHTPR